MKKNALALKNYKIYFTPSVFIESMQLHRPKIIHNQYVALQAKTFTHFLRKPVKSVVLYRTPHASGKGFYIFSIHPVLKIDRFCEIIFVKTK